MQELTCQPGTIVRAIAGRDAGRFFVVLAKCGSSPTASVQRETDLLLADGQTRSLSHPKRKNPLHIQCTAQTVSLDDLNDARLRSLLRSLNPPSVAGSRMNDKSRKEVIDDVEAGCN